MFSTVTVRVVESDAYTVDPDYSEASVTIQDGDIPDVEFEASSSVQDEAVAEAVVGVRLSRTWKEDMEIDFMGEKGNKFWFALHSKISSNVYLTLKYKIKRYTCREYEWRAWWNDVGDVGDANYLDRVERTDHALRLNLDIRL